MVSEELSILNTFHPGITLSLPLTCQTLCSWLTMGGSISHVCGLYWYIVGTCSGFPVYTPHFYNNLYWPLRLLVLPFTDNRFDQGTYNTLRSQYWWTSDFVVTNCLVSCERILILICWCTWITCCYCCMIVCLLDFGELGLFVLTYIVITNPCVLIGAVLFCITLIMYYTHVYKFFHSLHISMNLSFIFKFIYISLFIWCIYLCIIMYMFILLVCGYYLTYVCILVYLFLWHFYFTRGVMQFIFLALILIPASISCSYFHNSLFILYPV